jgi:hypothetical protein
LLSIQNKWLSFFPKGYKCPYRLKGLPLGSGEGQDQESRDDPKVRDQKGTYRLRLVDFLPADQVILRMTEVMK